MRDAPLLPMACWSETFEQLLPVFDLSLPVQYWSRVESILLSHYAVGTNKDDIRTYPLPDHCLVWIFRFPFNFR